MSEFMQLVESYNAADASAQALFGGRDLRGYGNLTQKKRTLESHPKVGPALREFRTIYGDACAGDPQAYRILKEAITTSDFPLLFGDTIDRLLLAKYRTHPATWRDYVKVSDVSDFRKAKRFKASIGRGYLPEVKELESYKSDKPSESYYEFAVQKFGGVRNISWEALINDDLGSLRDTPDDLAAQAANTEWYYVTSLFAANTDLYKTDHAVPGGTASNKLTVALTPDNLALAIGQMADFPSDDDDGTPIMNDPIYIVCGSKTTEFKATQILSSTTVAYTGGSGAADRDNLPTMMIVPQEVRNRMFVRYNPWIRLFDPTNYDTSWYLFADKTMGWAVEAAFLRGYAQPQMFMRASSQMMLGGLADPLVGGFDNDAVDYKVRHVIGGSSTEAVGGWRFTLWSDGTA
jgi:hypothetical protein